MRYATHPVGDFTNRTKPWSAKEFFRAFAITPFFPANREITIGLLLSKFESKLETESYKSSSIRTASSSKTKSHSELAIE
jgi:hypothetical protein